MHCFAVLVFLDYNLSFFLYDDVRFFAFSLTLQTVYQEDCYNSMTQTEKNDIFYKFFKP